MEETKEAYLPTVAEIEQMSKEAFARWVCKARSELPKREEKRDPLTHLKKRISSVLDRRDISEEQRESIVLSELERYERIIFQPQ